jgi:two-component system NarL family response regulator
MLLRSTIPIRVCVVDDDEESFRLVSEVVAAAPKLKVVGCHAAHKELARKLLTLKPHVVILDFRFVGVSELACALDMRLRRDDIALIFRTASFENKELFEAIRLGARGFLVKQDGVHQIPDAVIRVSQGHTVFSESLLERLVGVFRHFGEIIHAPTNALTRRGEEILSHVQRGLANKEIAGRLGISEGTVHCHLSHVFQKLNVSCRTSAVMTYLSCAQAHQCPFSRFRNHDASVSQLTSDSLRHTR